MRRSIKSMNRNKRRYPFTLRKRNIRCGVEVAFINILMRAKINNPNTVKWKSIDAGIPPRGNWRDVFEKQAEEIGKEYAGLVKCKS